MTKYERKLNEIVDDVFESAANRGWSWVQLAAEANLCISTVYNLGNRQTKLPRFQTVFLLCQCVGMEIHATQLRLRKAV